MHILMVSFSCSPASLDNFLYFSYKFSYFNRFQGRTFFATFSLVLQILINVQSINDVFRKATEKARKILKNTEKEADIHKKTSKYAFKI